MAVDIGARASGTEESRNRARALFNATAAPTAIIGLEQQRVDVWFNCHNGMTAVPGSVALNTKALEKAFRDHQTDVRRERLAELRTGQRHLFENHLYALRGNLVGYLHRGIRAAVDQLGDWWNSDNKKYLTAKYSNLRVAFSKIALALLAARILEDKGALGAGRGQSTDARKLLDDACQKWDSFFDDVVEQQLPILDRGFPDDADEMLESLLGHLTGPVHFGLVTHEMLGDLYEQADLPARRFAVAQKALITDEFRLQGVHYTPFPIARRIVDRIPFEDLRPSERVTCDLTCGSGSFLVATTDRLAELYDPRERDAGSDRIAYLQRSVCGNDLDDVALLLVKLTYLLAYWSRSRGSDGIAYPNIVSGNALDLDPARAFGIRPSVFVGNPPFDSDEPAGDFLTRAIDFLWRREKGQCGYIGMVLPQGFLKGDQHHQVARSYLLNHARLLEVWELPERTVGDTAEVSTCVIVAEVRAGQAGTPRAVRVEQTFSRRKEARSAIRDAGLPTWSYSAMLGGETITAAPVDSLSKLNQPGRPALGDLANVVWGFLHTKDKKYESPVFHTKPATGRVPYFHLQSKLRPYCLTEADWEECHANGKGYWEQGTGPGPRHENWLHYESPKIVVASQGNPNQQAQLIAAVDLEQRYPGKHFIVITLREGWEHTFRNLSQIPLDGGESLVSQESTLRWLCAILNSPIGHAYAAVNNTARGGQAKQWTSFNIPATYDPRIAVLVEVLERLPRPANLVDTPTWDPPTMTAAPTSQSAPSLPGMEDEEPEPSGNAYWELVREINQRVFETYGLNADDQRQIMTFLRSMTDPWAAHGKDVADLPPHTELRVMQGAVHSIDVGAQTISLKLSWAAFRPGPVTIPIPKFMPGWALEEGRGFTCRAPRETKIDDLRKNEWLLRDFRPLPYGYLSVPELERMLGYQANGTSNT
ncbi:hypothetical protein VT84_24335 [Gemmata sp. SH-PL17]|uniref:HsdM family class I SAM-dependent methyltransferase n=1 Tax=Gemmata sp. SH-PL17 TaxID=1630693 RepID=UPI00078D03C8|nr:N-6 DNA methylase [Gemmata sp. SH-PL17]AMV27552.1 hypothetical protein VT84_24335 [Gemmata sp. SH-PL17]